jgi:hypothetical protein
MDGETELTEALPQKERAGAERAETSKKALARAPPGPKVSRMGPIRVVSNRG